MFGALGMNDASPTLPSAVSAAAAAAAAEPVAAASPTQHQQRQDDPDDISQYEKGKGKFIKNPTGKYVRGCLPGCMFSSQAPVCAWPILGVMHCASTTTFCIFVAQGEVLSCVLAATCTFIAMFSLIYGGSIDPGIIPPARVDDVPYPKGFRHKHTIEGIEIVTDVCERCNILKPPRAGHCGTMDVHVRELDHNCGVLQQLVAERNFRWFVHFMYSTVALCIIVFVRCIVELSRISYEDEAKTSFGIARMVFSFGLIVVAALAGCITLGMSVHYTHMSCRGITLKDERGRTQYMPDESAYSCTRCVCRLFGPVPPSQLPDDLSFEDVKEAKDQPRPFVSVM